MIKIHVRDCNGNRETWEFSTNHDLIEFLNESIEELDEDMYEIQMIVYNGCCIYSGLTDKDITFEELLGFFA